MCCDSRTYEYLLPVDLLQSAITHRPKMDSAEMTMQLCVMWITWMDKIRCSCVVWMIRVPLPTAAYLAQH